MEGGQDVGYLRGGTGWYRKELVIGGKDQGKQVYLYFDGVQSEMRLVVNGMEAGRHMYGYTPFYFNITPYLKSPGEANQLEVKVVNPERNSRWFAGAGIYRDVSLSIVPPVHLDIWGISVETVSLADGSAEIDLTATILNKTAPDVNAEIMVRIINPGGSASVEEAQEIPVPGNGSANGHFRIIIRDPEPWSPASPELYTARIAVRQEEGETDVCEQTFGIRTLDFSAEKGFLLNGEPVLLKGGCVHHDNGILGAAAFRQAEFRRVRLLKENGFNAIRCAHNPPSAHFLDACDRLGMLVIDETFDMWIKPKRPNDYHRHYREWWERDTRAMVLRDRNHPSVIMWSVGNEVQERADSSGLAIAKAAYDLIRSIDSTRPVTQAICGFWDNPGLEWEDTAPAFARMDVGGYNYQHVHYEPDHARFPERIIFGSESVAREAKVNWDLVEKHPYVIGDFVWTAMDYVGEATIGRSQYSQDPGASLPFHMTWPWYHANCGDIDLAGDKKPQSYFRDVLWGESDLELAVHEPVPAGMHEVVFYWGWPREHQSWNWKGYEGNILSVNVYSSCPEVRLELNGRDLGRREIDTATLTATCQVPYEPGELKAIGIKDGMEVESKVLRTAGNPSRLVLSPERTDFAAGRGEIEFLKITITDAEGLWIPLDSSLVRVTVSGEAELIAAGSAGVLAEGSLQDEELRLYNGRGLAVIRSTGRTGMIRVTAETPGLEPAVAELSAY